MDLAAQSRTSIILSTDRSVFIIIFGNGKHDLGKLKEADSSIFVNLSHGSIGVDIGHGKHGVDLLGGKLLSIIF